jgi:hypothetical protein
MLEMIYISSIAKDLENKILGGLISNFQDTREM